MQVSRLVVTPTAGFNERGRDKATSTAFSRLRRPGARCLRLSEDLPVVPTLADFGVDAGGRARHRRSPCFHRGVSLLFSEGEGPSQKYVNIQALTPGWGTGQGLSDTAERFTGK